MHEFSTAKGIVETILAVAKEHGAKRITEVNLQIGILTMLNPEQLEFAFQALTEDTIAKEAKLNISYLPMKLICNSCGLSKDISVSRIEDSSEVITMLKCPRCGSNDTQVDEGRNCNIRDIRIEKDDTT
jgi:hydrogenase nickel incorporation protein HypA/HybF